MAVAGRSRQWTIVDGMILVAATGVGLVVVRKIYQELEYGIAAITDLRQFGLLAQPLMLAWAVGLLVVGLNRAREPIWRLMRRPGILACLMAVVFTVLSLAVRYGAVYVAQQRGVSSPFGLASSTLLGVISSSLATGFAIAFAWSTLLLTVWRPSPDWVDRLGRLLGVGWIMLWVPLNLGL